MKKFATGGIAVISLSIGALVFFQISASSTTSSPTLSAAVIPATPPPTPISEMAKPKTLHIDKLGINSPIQEVGLDRNGDMATPPNETSVGWYAGGPSPGNVGRAVLAAHTGFPEVPTIFRKFEDLQQGDVFSIEDIRGQTAEFEVIETATYTPDTAPRNLIFGPSSTARISLITCIGTWIPKQKTYSHRLVVYAVRKA